MSGVEQRARELLAAACGMDGLIPNSVRCGTAISAIAAALASQGEKQVGPDAESAARAYERYQDAGATHEQALHAALADALASQAQVPDEPDQALLISMATCLNHGFGLLPADRQQSMLRDMRKLWDEVMGRGYYSPQCRERYTSMLAAAPAPEVSG